ncbi:hypothetical protein ABKN59_006041 [Abortiporus biennis]
MSRQSFVFTMAGPGSITSDIQNILSAIDERHTPSTTIASSSSTTSSTRAIRYPGPFPAPIKRPHSSPIKRSLSPSPLTVIGLGFYLDGEVYMPTSPTNEEDRDLFTQPLLPTRRSSPTRIEGVLDDDDEGKDTIPTRMRASSHHFDAPPAEDLPTPFVFDAPFSNDGVATTMGSISSLTTTTSDESDEDSESLISPITSEGEQQRDEVEEYSYGVDIFSPLPTTPYSVTNPICVFVDIMTTITYEFDDSDSDLEFENSEEDDDRGGYITTVDDASHAHNENEGKEEEAHYHLPTNLLASPQVEGYGGYEVTASVIVPDYHDEAQYPFSPDMYRPAMDVIYQTRPRGMQERSPFIY